ncbi:hypothetical protein M877_29030 [Streptomyces niveus NCIMB 11891]|nr:hypothetical protein M877_29030 [Streptomyces niveus NCIMB 11891]
MERGVKALADEYGAIGLKLVPHCCAFDLETGRGVLSVGVGVALDSLSFEFERGQASHVPHALVVRFPGGVR